MYLRFFPITGLVHSSKHRPEAFVRHSWGSRQRISIHLHSGWQGWFVYQIKVYSPELSPFKRMQKRFNLSFNSGWHLVQQHQERVLPVVWRWDDHPAPLPPEERHHVWQEKTRRCSGDNFLQEFVIDFHLTCTMVI